MQASGRRWGCPVAASSSFLQPKPLLLHSSGRLWRNRRGVVPEKDRETAADSTALLGNTTVERSPHSCANAAAALFRSSISHSIRLNGCFSADTGILGSQNRTDGDTFIHRQIRLVCSDAHLRGCYLQNPILHAAYEDASNARGVWVLGAHGNNANNQL